MATARGDALYRWADLAPRDAVPLDLPDEPALQSIILVRDGEAVRAFENSCPHKGTTLENPIDRVIDASGEHLVCATHGARFRITDGVCVSGPCLGKRLATVPVVRRDGLVMLGSGATPPKV